MRQILSGWISIAIGLAGLFISLQLNLWNFTILQTVFFTIAAVGLIAMICWDIYSHLKTRPKICKSTGEIDEYMRKWVSQRGRAMIFTRDMSWAHQDPTKQLLMEKGKNNELEICLPSSTSLTDELAAHGAKVYTYNDLLDEPYSRFTIIRYGRDDARVAIGRAVDGQHRIVEYTAGHDPVFSVAYDLIRLVNKISSQNGNANGTETSRL